MAYTRPLAFVFVTLICLIGDSYAAQQYLGKFVGKLTELHHGVSGEVYAVDARTLHIKDLTYDGEGPTAYFYAGSTRAPGAGGFRIRDENGSGSPLKRYRRKSVTITLPEGKTLNNIKWFSLWCEEYAVNFGDVKIPRGFDYPKPQKVEGLQGIHGVSSDPVIIVDAQTLLIPNFSYDGEAPDAKFWVGRGSKPTPQGIRIPDENGKEVPLRRYDHKTVVLTLPGDLTVFDIGHFGVWCEAFTVDFGHVKIPQQLNIPPSLKMLGVSPQSKLNCEVLHDNLAFEVRWAVAGESIVLQLVAKLDDGEYMSFGLSGDNSKTQMIGGDVVVAWVDRNTLKGYAEDYFLEAKSQCSGPSGSCPDERLADNTNNIRLLNAAMVNGYSIVTYQRPLKPTDELDREIFINRSQPIIWAIGPLNQRNEVSFHSTFTKKDHFLDFGRPASWNCPISEADSNAENIQAPSQTIQRKTEVEEPNNTVSVNSRRRVTERRRGSNAETTERSRTEDRPISRRRGPTTTTAAPTTTRPIPTPKAVSNRHAWYIPPIQCDEPDDGVFYAQMGPTGGKHGYPAITGHVGWGISWYINGLLIPEINVVRGKTYTFVTEGGIDPDFPAKYHPFYITDDPIGGYEYKTPAERESVRIFAGVEKTRDGKVYPTGVGRLCHWTHTGDKEADEFPSFGAFQRTLELRCDKGEPGFITWTPDSKTPDTVYYQCFTHRYLGWKINVLDSCDSNSKASEPEAAVALPDQSDNGDLKSSPSILVETRIKPNDLFQTTHIKQITDEDGDFKPNPELISNFTTVTPKDDLTSTSTRSTLPTFNRVSQRPTRPKLRPQLNKIRRPIHPIPFIIKPLTLSRRPPPTHYKKIFIPLRKPIRPPQKKQKPSVDSFKIIKTNKKENTSFVTPNKIKLNTSSELLSVQKEFSTMRPAINTGFKPESVVIESGFKPIITEIQKRIDDLETQQETGIIKPTTNHFTENFEPVFVPSPPDSLNNKKNISKLIKKSPSIVLVVKHGRKMLQEEEDEIAMAAERVESYYLPPDNKKPVGRIRKPSNIDIPPGTVVTFDGKRVSGTSLTAPISLEPQPSRPSEILRLSPQFGPFRGEIPPLPDKINLANLPQLNSQAVISRNLNAPSQTTRLSPVRYRREIRSIRKIRNAHHTPEHTQQQKSQKQEKNSSSYIYCNYYLILSVAIINFQKYILF